MRVVLQEYDIFMGIDVGFKGAIAGLFVNSGEIKVWDMPLRACPRGHELDLNALAELLMPPGEGKFAWGLEYNQSRPHDPPEAACRFCYQTGAIEGILAAKYGEDHIYRVAPQLWKGRLGLRGKELDPNSLDGQSLWYKLHCDKMALIRGPRGGVKDGRLDALLIAEFLRRQTPGFASL